MSITADDQLEPGNQITLFEVDGTAFGADVLYFHNHAVAYTEEVLAAGDDESKLPGKPIYSLWQGIRYDLWPCQIEDIEANGDGTPVSPKLSVGNLDGSISALCHLFQDMKQAKVTIHRTYAHYLDASNFPDGNSQAYSTAEQLEVFYIDSKTADNETDVQFKLSSPSDDRAEGSRLANYQPLRLVPAGPISGCGWRLHRHAQAFERVLATRLIALQMMSAPERSQAASCAGGKMSSCRLRLLAIAITRI
ncbi:phage minor tail protein L [Enterobacter cloacae complex sp. 379K3]|uniref:phage minor tail protein L n=1 Tax=Enterobacter cloacae complex sp. 379K3 TaxID=3395865 RepID=UPI003CF6CB61